MNYFYTPKEQGLTPIINGRKTRILKYDEAIKPGDWCVTTNIAAGGKVEWFQVNILDVWSCPFPNGNIVIRMVEEDKKVSFSFDPGYPISLTKEEIKKLSDEGVKLSKAIEKQMEEMKRINPDDLKVVCK